MDPVGGALLGTVVSELYKCVADLYANNRSFKKNREDIQSMRDKLNSVVAEMAPNAELEGLQKVLTAGLKLVDNCSNVRWMEIRRKHKYTKRFDEWKKDLHRQLALLPVLGIKDGKKILEAVECLKVSTGNMQASIEASLAAESRSTESEGWCAVPDLPEVVVGLEDHVKHLKRELLGNGKFPMLVLTAPGGCGKTTLAMKFCQDEEVKGVFGRNIFFVSVLKENSLHSIVEQLCGSKGSRVPAFPNEIIAVQWLQRFLKEEGKKPLLLVLDGVLSGSESLLHKFECQQTYIKILVTSRFEFKAPFICCYPLPVLSYDDAFELFHHSASLGDESSHIPEHLSRKVVEHCKRSPLAITVVGRSLCALPREMWQNRLNQWSRGSSILDSEPDLLLCLQSSLDTLDEKIKKCFLDLGLFPEDKRIPATALFDIWAESYGEDDTWCFASLYELKKRSLANLIDERKSKLDGEGYYGELYVTLHDVLRELAVSLSRKPDSVEQRERLFIDMCGSNHSEWWRQEEHRVMRARLLSISASCPVFPRLLSVSADGDFSTLKWPNMHLPETEVLLLNLETPRGELSEVMSMDELSEQEEEVMSMDELSEQEEEARDELSEQEEEVMSMDELSEQEEEARDELSEQLLNFQMSGYSTPELEKMDELSEEEEEEMDELSEQEKMDELPELALPEFVERMDKLKVLVITAGVGYLGRRLSNFELLSRLSNLKRITLNGCLISFIFKNSIQVKSLRKLSLVNCGTGIGPDRLPHVFADRFPNLEEIYIEDMNPWALCTLLTGLCHLISLKKLTLSGPCRPSPSDIVSMVSLQIVEKFTLSGPCPLLVPFPDEIGSLVNLEVLRLRSMFYLSELPNSIRNLKKLNFFGIYNCPQLGELPEYIGEMSSLKTIDVRSCDRVKQLPRSVLDLKQLEEVICDEDTKSLWESLLPSFRGITIAPPSVPSRSVSDLKQLEEVISLICDEDTKTYGNPC